MTQTTEQPIALRAYSIWFTGRRVGAIGAMEEISTTRFAHSPEEALRLCYEPMPIAFEHISQPKVKEIPSPFGWESLVNHITHERETLESFTHWLNMMKSEMARVARRVSKANKEWHDDPEGEDHPLFQAETEAKFPPHVQLIALAELMSYLLSNTPAGLTVFDRLRLPDDVEFKGGEIWTPESGEKGGE